MRLYIKDYQKHAILLFFFCFSFSSTLFAQQLQELVTFRYEEPPQQLSILPDFPDHAQLIIHSSIPNLTFESNWKIYDDLSTPGSGMYLLILDPIRQLLRVSVPGEYKVTEIMVDDLNAKEAAYYSIEPANTSRFVEIIALYADGEYQQAVTQINGYLSRPNLNDIQRKEAYYLLGKSLFALDQLAEMKTALKHLLELAPDFEPNTAGDPPAITQYIVHHQDSVLQQPPASPKNFRAFSNGSQIRLEWTPNTESDLAGYRIYRGQDPLLKNVIATASAESSTFLDPDVTPFETYFYHITAYDNSQPANESPPSSTREVETLPPLSERIEIEVNDDSFLRAVEFQDSGDSLLTISYELVGAFKRFYDISITLSGGRLAPSAFRGDYGKDVQDGLFKRIQWNVLSDFPGGLNEERYVMQIVATPQPLLDQLTLSTNTPAMAQDMQFSARNDSMITVSYTLPGSPKKKYSVALSLSRNNGPFSLTPQALLGHVGGGITRGSNKEIAWDILKDFPAGLDGNYELQLSIVEASTPKRGKWWLATGGALLAGGAAAFILSNNGENPTETDPVASAPPGRPE
ncbi:MAG: hypothetical protein AB8G77_28650 [Rhodothermales bacterium]